MHKHKRLTARGFTIVEMVVVIVIIALLTALVVAINSTLRAEAEKSAAQADAKQVYTKIGNFAMSNDDQFPETLAEIGITAQPGGSTYQYSVNNSTEYPKTFCITAKNGSHYYRVSNNDTSPVEGACAGHVGSEILVSAGFRHACAVIDGAAKCWGFNGSGQIGNGNTTDASVATQVIGLESEVTAISAGVNHTCAVVDGAAKCWGNSEALGAGYPMSQKITTPQDVIGLNSGVTAISAGNQQSCAIVNGGAKCWGWNLFGSVGNGAYEQYFTNETTDVIGLTSGVTKISAGWGSTCAVVNGGAKCWGTNNRGPGLGDGINNTSITPVDVSGLSSGVTDITAQADGGVMCAVVNGGAKCWGDNGYHQLGDGTTTSSTVPVNVSALPSGSGVTSIGVGEAHACALVNNVPKCWGNNSYGNIGIGYNSSWEPVSTVLNLSNKVSALDVGNKGSCVVDQGLVKCWVGTASVIETNTPIAVPGLQ